jgi:NTE family protein
VRATVESGSLLDITFPYMALAKGHTLTNGIVAALGTMRIEDLPAEFFCVSSDLTAGRLRVHDRGPLADAVRASVAIPGIFPPMRSPEGHVLVDGGIMDNLPVAEMRTRLEGGRVVAVDLRTRNELPSAELPDGGAASGWQPLLRRLNPAKPRMEVPRMIDLLIRSTELASGDRHDTADVTLRPPVEGFGLLEFTAYESLIEAGYRYAAELIEGEGVEVFGG